MQKEVINKQNNFHKPLLVIHFAMNSCKSLPFNAKSLVHINETYKKKRGISIIIILDNNGFTSSHTNDFLLI